MNARAGESQMKHRISTVILWLFTKIPLTIIVWSSVTSGVKNAFKSVGFDLPKNIPMTIGL